ncbi:MAG: nitroreductase family protein [Rhodospirillaceae bacterium]|nr:nitroreductase family protein [Rhodospirillaceae bacterium]
MSKSDLFEVIETRHSCRAYLEKPVDPNILTDIIERAGRTPSNGNVQPWLVHALTGQPLEELKKIAAQTVKTQNPHINDAEFDVYPSDMVEPYVSRRETHGANLYRSLNIDRDNLDLRLGWYRRNFEFFGAPVGLIFCIERQLGQPQWADLGSFIQTVTYLARGHGLDTCTQVAWSRIYGTVADFLNLPPNHMVYCGMSMGYGDPSHPVNNFRMPRAPVEEICQFHGFD